MADTPSPIQPLPYAPADGPFRRLARPRSVLLLLAVLALASAYGWAPLAWHRAQLQYWQWRCLRYQAPAHTVVLSSATVGQLTPVVPPEWARYYHLVSPPGLASSGTLFLHELRSSTGERLLAAIDLPRNLAASLPVISVHVRLFKPRGASATPIVLQDTLMYLATIDSRPFELCAGQVDPADATHFTLVYRLGAESRTIDGWLRAGSVVLEERRPPIPTLPSSPG